MFRLAAEAEFRRRARRVLPRAAVSGSLALGVLAAAGSPAAAQALATAPPDPGPPSAAALQQIQRELQDLKAEEAAAKAAEQDRARRIDALEQQLGAAPSAAGVAPEIQTIAAQPAPAKPPVKWGAFEPGKGFVLARTDKGEMDVTFITYLRYLNQTSLQSTSTDFFGKTTTLDLKQDIQLNKINLTFKGWLFDPRFRYLLFLWTNNSAQGEGAQVVIAGHLDYDFASWLTLGGGIDALPTTRSTTGNYPMWLRNDNRLMADEFFRGSYTEGVYLMGKFDRFQYEVMVGNNLSILGVGANQLAPSLKTYSAYLRWMPTTGEFGPVAGYGDYENHKSIATDLEAHYTYSREDAQGQSGTDTIENSQIRLSDGERLFDPNVFGTPYRIKEATYQMAAFDAAVKHKGFALEGEYYVRWVDDFVATGPLPYSHMYDTGISLQASAMPIQKKLQLYATYSHIWGQFGSPSEAVFGLNWFPFGNKNFRITPNAMWFDKSPVGYSGVPYVIGGKGWAFYLDAALYNF